MALKPDKSQIAVRKHRRRTKRNNTNLLLTLGGLLMVGLLFYLGFQFFSHSGDTLSSTDPVTNKDSASMDMSATVPSGKQDSPWLNPGFISVVRSKLADSLHLSTDQLTAKLQAHMQIDEIATQQGISSDQLHTIELAAIQAGLAELVSTNQSTQELANANMQHFQQRDPQRLNTDITYSLGGTIPNGKLPVTPTVLSK